MHKRSLLTIALLSIMLLAFAGCGNESAQVKYTDADVNTDNELAVNNLVDYMLPLSETQKDTNILSSLKAAVSNNETDFSSITYSDDTVCVGDVSYVEGVIPKENYPSDNILMGSDPERIVSLENAVLTNKEGNTIFTMDVVGEEVGTATVVVALKDGEKYYSFDIDVVDTTHRTLPNYSDITVYCTPTGEKYHSYGCGYLRGNGIAISLQEALARGLGPCSRCQ